MSGSAPQERAGGAVSHPVDAADTGAARLRRELTAAVLGCALGGALALSAASQRWLQVTITRQPPLPPATQVLTGSQVAALVPACGLLLLASAVAMIAVRGLGRTAVGLLVALAGVVLGWSGLRALTGGLGATAADVSGVVGLGGARPTSSLVATWPALTLVAGLLAVLAGSLVVLRGRHWPGMGRRYERTGPSPAAAGAQRARPARPETAEDRHQAAWKALDRGEDPTAGPIV
ncbi:MAG: Trp biosynthesis associated, transrane protein Oprn/Chp [Modestobacter sp.]|nr:Trp biosynthesis associated, transrane protein Oprn/Chp [Modestobacter sp.]